MCISTNVDSAVIHIRLDDPENNNRINPALLNAMHAALDRAHRDDIRAIAISASGSVFSDGFDFNSLARMERAPIRAIKPLVHRYQRLLNRLYHFPKPIVCILNGAVRAGGVGIVAASDYVIATPNVTCEISELFFGLIPAAVMPYLMRRIPPQHIRALALGATPITARRAETIGIVDQIADPDDLLSAVRSILKQFLRLRPHAVRQLKKYSAAFAHGGSINRQSRIAGDCFTRLIRQPGLAATINALIEEGAIPEWFQQYRPDRALLGRLYDG